MPNKQKCFISESRLKRVRNSLRNPDGHHAAAFAALKWRVDQGDLDVYGKWNFGYQRTWLAREAAFLALLEEDEESKSHYAQIAFAALHDVFEGDNQDRYPHRDYGLSRGMMGLGFGLACNWCGDLWESEQAAWVKEKIDRALEVWPAYEHANLGDVRASNWIAVCRGGELLLIYTAGEVKTRSARVDFLKGELLLHIQNGYGSMGMSQEGLGYTEYPGVFLLASAIIMAEGGDDELLRAAQSRAWWKLAMYTHSFQPHARKFLMTGVVHSSCPDEGWASLLLKLTPKEDLPAFLWWYDRHMGRLAPGNSQQKFDSQRAGTIWSLLYYPEGVEAVDPTASWPRAIEDSRGFFFFRNRWQDENDIQVSLMADTHQHGHAWDQPEALALNLMAFNTRFIGGPGKEGGGKNDPEHQLFSSLLVDGIYKHGVKSAFVGETDYFEPRDDGGYLIVRGGRHYESLGVSHVERHMLVYFGEDLSIIATLDCIESHAEHVYTWQANIGDEKGSDDVELSGSLDCARPSFLLRGRNEGYVYGLALHPSDADLNAEVPLRIRTSGRGAEILVVMLVGRGELPGINVEGEGLNSSLEVAGKSLLWDAEARRINFR